MTIDEFLHRAASQPIVNEERMVNVWGPELKALVTERKAMTLAEIDAHPDQHKEKRIFRRGHLLGSGLPHDAIISWQQKHPSHILPPGLIELLSRVNGIDLWADLDSQEAYFGILPLEKWQTASESRLADYCENEPSSHLVISYHQNGDFHLVLDSQRAAYFWYDTEDFRHPTLVARDVEELLSWWWKQAAELAPETPASR
jgi:hypothetical protein